MARFPSFVLLAVSLISSTTAFPAHGSLAGLSRDELDIIIPRLHVAQPEKPPGPLAFNGTKLVNDAQHPWKPLEDGDMRGPCPGLNTLASHGYLPRNGIATPAQIINAVQEGLNMENNLARMIAYFALLVDGNVVTNLLSIGGKTDLTGPNPPAPATVAGLDTHGTFEGDASMTRGDAYFGDNHSFNETLFEELVEYSNQYGAGKYNLTVAGEFIYKRIQESIAMNPTFTFKDAPYSGAYIGTTFPVHFFIDGRQMDGQLDIDVARGFFQDMRMPDDFHRASKPMIAEGGDIVYRAHPFLPGGNVNGVNTYTPDPTTPDFLSTSGCLLYEVFANKSALALYPNPTGVLRKALDINLQFLYDTTNGECEQVFPWGKPEDNE